MAGPPEQQCSEKHSETGKKSQEKINFLATVSLFFWDAGGVFADEEVQRRADQEVQRS
jgi:hypothetical protein